MTEWIPVVVIFAIAIGMTFYFASRQFKKREDKKDD